MYIRGGWLYLFHNMVEFRVECLFCGVFGCRNIVVYD